jgi:hypothetical protein
MWCRSCETGCKIKNGGEFTKVEQSETVISRDHERDSVTKKLTLFCAQKSRFSLGVTRYHPNSAKWSRKSVTLAEFGHTDWDPRPVAS